MDLLRINLSHTRIEDPRAAIDLIWACSHVPISLDTEGAQVRCGSAVAGPHPGDGLDDRPPPHAPVRGDAQRISLRPRCIFEMLEPERHDDDRLPGGHAPRDRAARERCSGPHRARRSSRVDSNRAVTIAPLPSLPPLTRKDVAAIGLGRRLGIRPLRPLDRRVAGGRGIGAKADPIGRAPHLEDREPSRRAQHGRDHRRMDAVLIDRGDLSREIPLEEVPYYQR